MMNKAELNILLNKYKKYKSLMKCANSVMIYGKYDGKNFINRPKNYWYKVN
jgi:uncharacterized protein (DUF3820 family)